MFELTPGSLSPRQVFHGRYEIVRCLKAGGMGAVYECIHRKTRKHRALKVMLPQLLAEAGMRERFELEARVTADIDSEHIVETFDAGIDDATGAPFLVMELLRGEDLASVVQKRGPLPAGETVLLLAQAALALDKTHAAGIVHRDLKPENLYLTMRDDGSPRLKILDFGIAKVVAAGNQSVQQTATIGTPLYMPREQILGEGTIGPRADIYALGHIAFALLTGAPYWADEQKAFPAMFIFLGQVMAGASEPATARAARRGVALPPAFDAWFARATAKSADDRFEGASTLVQELALALGVSAPRLGSLPAVVPDLCVSAPSLVDWTLLATEPAPEAMPYGPPETTEPAPEATPYGPPATTVSEATTVGEATTMVASTKSVESPGSISRQPSLRLAAVGLTAIGSVGLGLLMTSMWSPAPSPAPLVGAPADMPSVDAGAPEVAAAPTPSAAPEPTSPATAAPASSPAATATSRPKPAAVKAAAPANPCNPPYVINSVGHRVIKPQCR